MSGQATGWVLRHGPHDRAMRAVLITIADAANRDGEHAHPGSEAMIEGSLYGRRQVQRIVAKLITEGWVKVESEGGGRGIATVYCIPGVARKGDVVTPLTDQKPRHPETETAPSRSETAPSETETAPSQGSDHDVRDAYGLYNEENNGNHSTRVGEPDGSRRAADGDSLPAVVVRSGHIEHARRLCDLLADELGTRTAKRPTVTRTWLVDMEALLRLDDREPVDVERVIRWLSRGADKTAAFWRPNIRSPAKLRAQWDQMREQYERDRSNGRPSAQAEFDRVHRLAKEAMGVSQ